MDSTLCRFIFGQEMHGLHPFRDVDDQNPVEDVPKVRIALHLYLSQVRMPDLFIYWLTFGSTSLGDDE
jgi:hypothetical protein